jgi:hypothetical protein
MQEMMSLFSKDGKIGRWMTKRPISILVGLCCPDCLAGSRDIGYSGNRG